MTWQGRRLMSATNGTNTVSYTYDENGIRTQKTVNGTATSYRYHGSVLISQVTGNDKLLFSYDANGNVVAVNYNGTYYHYVRNGQGDIVKLIDGNGSAVVEYSYDSWGKSLAVTETLASTLGALNPFRYRGYVYDTETRLYYLQSRYYDPEVGRFLNADRFVGTGQGLLGHNMYVYCNNNPIVRSDESGTVWIPIGTVIGLIGVAVTTAVNHVVNAVNFRKINMELKESYSVKEAEREINDILSPYTSTSIEFNYEKNSVKISGSYKVKSRYERQKVSEVLTRTEELFDRESDNISSEWLLHNLCFGMSIMEGSTKDADLDFIRDDRMITVCIPTKILEILGWE